MQKQTDNRIHFVIVVFLLLAFYSVKLCNVNAYNVSALPQEMCKQLEPGYIVDFLNRSHLKKEFCPFRVYHNTGFVENGDYVELEVRTEKYAPFMGFLMQAWFGSLCLSGSFIKQEDLDVYNCRLVKQQDLPELINDFENTAIHFDGTYKTSYKLVWQAPIYHIGDVNFYMTLIESNCSYYLYTRQVFVTVVTDIKAYMTTTTERKKKKKRKNEGGGLAEDQVVGPGVKKGAKKAAKPVEAVN